MNFARDVVDAAPPDRRALVEIRRGGSRKEWSFGEVADRSARLAATFATRHGVQQGDVVMTLIGNRPEWVLAMVACFRIGAVALPCNEQLRAKDLRHRLAVANPKLILADEPTGNLDSANGEAVMDMLTSITNGGTTIVMVTHSEEHAKRAHRVVHMLDGRLVTHPEDQPR
jgi:acyl-coenzyme A synthetase/AMP-(fatty) acid ligase